jgi:hypothetical protein
MRKFASTRTALAAAIAAGAFVALGFAGPAHAAGNSGQSTIRPMADSHTLPSVAVTVDGGGNRVSTLVDPFAVGDCLLDRGTTVTVRPPSGNFASVSIHGQVLTKHHQVAWYDQWHAKFTYWSRRGTKLAETSTMDSPQMRTDWKWYPFNAETAVFMPGDFYDLATNVDWWGEC